MNEPTREYFVASYLFATCDEMVIAGYDETKIRGTGSLRFARDDRAVNWKVDSTTLTLPSP